MTSSLPPMERPDVLVVGAGPAGSTVAGQLAREGFGIVLVDRQAFPRPKPCGECLNPGAVRALGRLGLLDRVLSLGPARLHGWDLAARDGLARARFGGDHVGLALPRRALDAALLDAAADGGADIRTGVVAGRPTLGPEGGVSVSVRSGGKRSVVRPRLLIGADGLRSRVARALNPERHRPSRSKVSLTCHIAGPGARPVGTLFLDGGTTVGLAPVARDGSVWNATVVVESERDRVAVAQDPLAAFRTALRRAPLTWAAGAGVVAGPWASGPFDRPARAVAAPGVLLVGDAAGYFDPLTGQGIYRALRSAELAAHAARALLRGSARPSRVRRAYAAAVRRAVAPGRRVQRAIDGIVRRSWLREPALGALACRPELSRRLVEVTGDVRPWWSLANPASWCHLSGETDAHS